MPRHDSRYRLPAAALWACGCLALAGVGCFLVGLWQAPDRAWANLLVDSYYLLGLGVGGAVLVALFHVTGASWSDALRRVPEAMTGLLPVAAVGLGLVLLARPSLYPWARAAGAGAESLSPFQHVWLSRPFFLSRSVLYVGLWMFLAWALVRSSRRADAQGGEAHAVRAGRPAALFLVVFGVTCWLAATDWIMSLEPNWSSTIFGVYQFAGMFVASLAAFGVAAIALDRQGPLRAYLGKDRLHDIGTLLFGFSSFWMYIWFCQYLLIWYVNDPEETAYLRLRQEGGWPTLLVLSLALNWGLPFVVLLFRRAKRSSLVMFAVCGVVLVGHWLDLYVAVLPPVVGPAAQPAPWEIGLGVSMAGAAVLAGARVLAQAPVVPVGAERSADHLGAANV